MKKILCLVLSIILAFSLISLVGCKEEVTSYKFGMGTYAYAAKATDADGDTNGEAEAVVNVAAVIVDNNGKIVKCVIDVADNKVAYTADGKAVAATEFKTKRELGNAYGMVAYANATKEWFEQADAFAALCVGKTVDEVVALEGADKKGNDEVVSAGCTIMVNEFVAAVKAAVENAKDANVSADDTVKLGVVSAQENKDASDEASGSCKVTTTVSAAAVAADGKVTAFAIDDIQAEFKFTTAGAKDGESKVTSKLALGANYGMAQYGQDLNGDGKVLEWNEQAAAFEAAVVGKSATEISALAVENGYGNDALQTAGCTVNVAAMVKAAVKAATVA